MTEKDTVSTESGVAVLAEGYTEDDAPFTVSGVALGEGDITRGQSGVPTMWDAEVLRPAASLFEGVNIVKNDHSADEQPSADNVIGEVTEARYKGGVGVVFKGEILDADIARKVDEGLLDVSPIMARELGDDEMEVNGQQVVPAESIRDVREIGIVMQGAAPSNEITTGTTAALSREALSQVFADNATDDEAAQASEDMGEARQPDDVQEHENETNNESMGEDEPDLSDEEREALAEIRKHDDAVVLSAEEYDALNEEIETAKDAYAEVLADEWGTDSEKIADNFALEALREEVEGMTEDEDGVGEALAQNPETGDADVDDEDEGGVDEEALERIDEIDTKLSTVGTALPDNRVEELQNEAMELADADSYDEALDYTEV